jgi:hypothetical protein
MEITLLSDQFRKLSDEQWLCVLIQSISEPIIAGIEFPRFPKVSPYRLTMWGMLMKMRSEKPIIFINL